MKDRTRNADLTRTKVPVPTPDLPVSADPPAPMSLQGAGHPAASPEIPVVEDTMVIKDKPVDKRQIAFWRGANEYPIAKCIITDNPRYLAGKLVAENVDDAVDIFRKFLEKELAK